MFLFDYGSYTMHFILFLFSLLGPIIAYFFLIPFIKYDKEEFRLIYSLGIFLIFASIVFGYTHYIDEGNTLESFSGF